MKYQIKIPIVIPEEYWNIGIDFGPMIVTGYKRGSDGEDTLIDLKKMCIRLDNRYIKEYKIERGEGETIIEIEY